MNYTLTEKLSKIAISQLIEEAKSVEVRRDSQLTREIFKPIWDDIDTQPDFSEYDDLQKAELLRLAGFLLSNYGKSKNILFYQERAKDLLTEAMDLFYHLNLKDEALEASVILALSYFYEGAINECEAILQQTASAYKGQQLHPVYLKTRINQISVMFWKAEYQEALEVIREIEIPLEFCEDKRLSGMFHTQSGVIFRGIGQYDQAIYHYNKAIEIGKEIGNLEGVGLNYNNLAFLYKHLGEFEAAHYHIGLAIKLFRELNNIGWLPHTIDTKALIYFAENKFELALKTIDEAIEIFRQGEHYAVLIESLWNKVRCLTALGRKEEAILLFTEITQIAQVRIGEVAVKKYTKLFSDIIFVKQDDSFENEVERFKKTEIINALHQANNNIEEAAKLLKLSKPKKLINILNNEFPELYASLGIPNLTKTPKSSKFMREIVLDEKTEISQPKLINQLQLNNIEYIFDETLGIRLNSKIKTFYFSAEKMLELFNVSFDAVVALTPLTQITSNAYVLIKEPNARDFSVARISHDENLNIYILLVNDEPFTPDEVEIIGKVIGYCSFEQINNEKLFFKSLPDLQAV